MPMQQLNSISILTKCSPIVSCDTSTFVFSMTTISSECFASLLNCAGSWWHWWILIRGWPQGHIVQRLRTTRKQLVRHVAHSSQVITARLTRVTMARGGFWVHRSHRCLSHRRHGGHRCLILRCKTLKASRCMRREPLVDASYLGTIRYYQLVMFMNQAFLFVLYTHITYIYSIYHV